VWLSDHQQIVDGARATLNAEEAIAAFRQMGAIETGRGVDRPECGV